MNEDDELIREPYSGAIDPEIASLLDLNETGGRGAGAPNFDDLFEGAKSTHESGSGPGREAVDLAQKTFAPIKDLTEAPKPYFTDKDYYKHTLQGEGESATRFHQIFSAFLNAKTNEDRSQARMRVIPAYWELLQVLARSMHSQMPQSKKLTIRYGLILPTLLSPEQRTFISSIIFDNKTGEPVHYIDEWLRKVGSAEITPLATDEEVRAVKKSADVSQWTARLEKAQGQFQAQAGLCRSKISEMKALEAEMTRWSQLLGQHELHGSFKNLEMYFGQPQRTALFNLQEGIKKLNYMDKELIGYFRDLEKIQHEVTLLEEKVNQGAGGESILDSKLVVSEVNSLRQMVKLACGRQGNHFPVLMKNYMPYRPEDMATRENVLTLMAEVERLDPGLFLRSFKGSFNRIVPHVILLPCYGDFGLCWEPFEKYNRSTSRGRVGIPMYPKNLKQAVIFALGDLRWQVAKEKAGYHWMEEGITGWYYQWFSERNMKGDVREFFIQDYILWITKESEGTQKLDKEVRGIFWRNLPFPQEVRDTLRNRGFAYNELYKKDQNRALSDGY